MYKVAKKIGVSDSRMKDECTVHKVIVPFTHNTASLLPHIIDTYHPKISYIHTSTSNYKIPIKFL